MINREDALIYSRLAIHTKRVINAKKIAEEALEQFSRPYIAFSTGKDSTCAMDITLKIAPDTPAVYFDAAAALPESDTLIERYSALGYDIERLKTTPFIQIYRDHAPDWAAVNRISDRLLVREPARKMARDRGHDLVILGNRADESRGRSVNAAARGPVYYCARDEISKAMPLLRWTEWDVWAYIFVNELPFNAAYEYGVRRICYWMGTVGRRRGRWLELKRHWPGLFNRFAAEFPEITQYV
jgi:3'-phosphoadenosine 5'-phosphosulfate sulfotransferase (PAPS reductase)/FAD synthetase